VVVVVGSSLLQLATSNSDKAVALAKSERRSGRLEESIDIVFDPRLAMVKMRDIRTRKTSEATFVFERAISDDDTSHQP
jgi:hypothetical protein